MRRRLRRLITISLRHYIGRKAIISVLIVPNAGTRKPILSYHLGIAWKREFVGISASRRAGDLPFD
jgi:hypothetical protein